MARLKQYWREKHEALALRWCSANTDSECTEIYIALKPNIIYLSRQIMQRYFSVAQAKQEDLLQDCSTEVFLRLKKYFNPQKQKAYSFCSMIAKHYLYEEAVRIPNVKEKPEIEFLDEQNENDTIDNRFSEGIEYPTAREIDFKAVSDFFIQKREKVQRKLDSLKLRMKTGKDIQKYEKYTYGNVIAKYNRHLQSCDLGLEFVEKYQSANVNLMAEFVFLNSKFGEATTISYFNRLFGVFVTLHRDNHISTDEKKDLDYINDDWTPNQNVHFKRMTKKRFQKKLNLD